MSYVRAQQLLFSYHLKLFHLRRNQNRIPDECVCVCACKDNTEPRMAKDLFIWFSSLSTWALLINFLFSCLLSKVCFILGWDKSCRVLLGHVHHPWFLRPFFSHLSLRCEEKAKVSKKSRSDIWITTFRYMLMLFGMFSPQSCVKSYWNLI